MVIKKCNLSDVSEIFSGFAFRSKDLSDYGIPVIKIGNIQNKTIIKECKKYFPTELLSKKHDRYFLQYSDTLVAMTGAGSVGKFGKMFNQGRSKYLVNQRVGVIRPNKLICHPSYIFYVLSNDVYEKILYGLGLGAGQPNVSAKEIGTLLIPFPPLPTQRKIAAILSAYDDLIENNMRRIKILEEMAQNLYREWFVKFRFPGHEQVRFVDSEMGRIPEGWGVEKLKFFGKILTGKTPSKSNPNYYNGNIQFIKTPDFQDNIFILDTKDCLSELGALSQKNKTIPIGTICVSCIGTIGKVSITSNSAQTNQQINSLIPKEKFLREFLFFRLKDEKKTLENLGATGVTMGNVNKGKFESVKIISPNFHLLSEFHHYCSQIFDETLILYRKNKTLRLTRDLLLPRLISGEVDVSDLDISFPKNDEL